MKKYIDDQQVIHDLKTAWYSTGKNQAAVCAELGISRQALISLLKHNISFEKVSRLAAVAGYSLHYELKPQRGKRSTASPPQNNTKNTPRKILPNPKNKNTI